MLKKVDAIVDKEIKYLSKFYTYDIKDFKDPELLHSRSMLVFRDPDDKLPDNLSSRIINLMAGIELLSVGLNLHTFNVDDFMMLIDKNNPSLKSKNPFEKNYTVDLLFGDVFYSRAVIYILEYGDFHIFNSILDSLKSAHKSRLLLHGKLMEHLKKNGNKSRSLNESGINSLLKTSFFVGYGIFSKYERIKLPYDIINDFILLKASNDIGDFFDRLLEKFGLSGNKSFISEKSRSIKNGLTSKIKDLEPPCIKANFKSLQNLY